MGRVLLELTDEELSDIVDSLGQASLDTVTAIIKGAVEAEIAPVIPLMVLVEVLEHNLEKNEPEGPNGWTSLRGRIKNKVLRSLTEMPTGVVDLKGILPSIDDEDSLH